MTSHRRDTGRGSVSHGVWKRVGGLGLIAAGVLAAGSAYAHTTTPDVLANVTGVASSARGTVGHGAASRGAEAFSVAGRSGSGSGSGSGGAHATAGGDGPLNSHGNSGVGSANQVKLPGRAPVVVDCNGRALLGNARSSCPAVAPEAGGYGGGGYGGGPGAPGGYGSPTPTPGTPTPTSGTPTPTPTPGTPTPTPGTPTKPPHKPTPTVAGTNKGGPSALPVTGSPAAYIGYAGGALLALGGGLVLLSRRKRTSARRS